jgi:hypothetical protein
MYCVSIISLTFKGRWITPCRAQILCTQMIPAHKIYIECVPASHGFKPPSDSGMHLTADTPQLKESVGGHNWRITVISAWEPVCWQWSVHVLVVWSLSKSPLSPVTRVHGTPTVQVLSFSWFIPNALLQITHFMGTGEVYKDNDFWTCGRAVAILKVCSLIFSVTILKNNVLVLLSFTHMFS